MLPWKRSDPDEEFRAREHYPPTQDHVFARGVRDDVLLLKDNTLVAVIGVGPLDLSLMTGEEREAKLMQYEDALREWRFPFQIIASTRPQNVEAYVAYLERCATERAGENHPHWAERARAHALVVRNLARQANAQLRHFLIALAYEDPAMIARRAVGRLAELSDEEFARGERELGRRAGHVVLSLQRIGLEAHRLDRGELTAELVNFYHPRLPRLETVSDEYFVNARLPFTGNSA